MGLSRFWGHDLDLLGLRDVIGHVTIGSADPDYPTLEPNPKWIRCSVAEIHLKDADRQTEKQRSGNALDDLKSA